MNTLNKQYLQECFTYDEHSNDYKWSERPITHFSSSGSQRITNSNAVGKYVGNIDRQGYVTVKLNNETHRLNKLIYFINNDYLPNKDEYIIHINGNRVDNRPENLKLVNKENNVEVDITGVYFYSRLEKFSAFVDRGKKRSLIGYYDTEEEAKSIREEYNNFKENNSAIPLPTQEYLLECFIYEPETGLLYWRERPLYHFDNVVSKQKRFNTLYANTLVNGRDDKNYILVPINKKYLKAHRIIWKMVYGEDPKYMIDHINGISDDNRIENLRDINNTNNQRNITKLKVDNVSGYVGVSYEYHKGKWKANIRDGKKSINVGLFNTKEIAALNRELKAKELYGEGFYDQDLIDKLNLIIDVSDNSWVDNTTRYRGVYSNIPEDNYGIFFTYNNHKKSHSAKGFSTADEAYLAMLIKKRELGLIS